VNFRNISANLILSWTYLCYSEDEKVLTEKRGFILFDISDVNTSEVERLRLEDGTPNLKFVRSPNSVIMATLEVTSDF